MDISVSYKVPVSNAAEVQNSLKALLDQQLDPAGAGGNYTDRYKEQFIKYGTEGMKEKLRAFRAAASVAAMRAANAAINATNDIGKPQNI